MLQYLALDEPECSINRQLSKSPITFHYSTNLQHPAPMQRVRPLIIGTWQDFFFI
jgi:hypothetical protein